MRIQECEPVGERDIAERLGVKPRTVSMWRYRTLTPPFPPPRWTVSGLPAWHWPEVKRWAKAAGRLAKD